MRKETIILVGFMGTGKSTVGRILADRLGWAFTDSDRFIEREQGMPIPDIFRERGEAAFRALETDAIKRLVRMRRRVIATGGGAVLAAENRKAMLAGGLVVALKARPETIVHRVGGGVDRPLLAGDVQNNVRRLYNERRNAYDFANLTVQTDGLSATDVAEVILNYMVKGNR